MSDRHRILADAEFWLALEYRLCGWFRSDGGASLGGFWCDGFLPHSARNTKVGVEIHGSVWIVDARQGQRQYSFVVAVPQRMLHRRRDDVALKDVEIDVAQATIRFAIEPGADA